MNTIVYKCANGCWFITAANTDADQTLHENDSIAWITIHPVVEAFHTEWHDTHLKAKCAAEAKTLEYMIRYGVDKVRGGSFTDVRVDMSRLAPALRYVSLSECQDTEDDFVDVELFCRRCGYEGHLADTCDAEVGIDGRVLDEEEW